MRLIPQLILLSSATYALLACSGSDITSPEDVIFPERNVSYAQHVAPYLALGCNMTGCHDQARPENNFIDLTSWAAVRSTRVVNQPGDTNAGLVQVLYGRIVHFPVRATDNQRQGIKQWVIEGAQNN
jgi:hypothetical protein